MNRLHAQRGITLVVSLIMLIVLTLLVVSAIRFGNINLRIANNAQVEAEATAAVQVALEKAVASVAAADRPSDVAKVDTLEVSTGGATYKVTVDKPVCMLSKNVENAELDPTKASDQPCYEEKTTSDIVGAVAPTACKDQQWDVSASIKDGDLNGAKVTVLQGVAVRVSAEVVCP